MIMETASFTGFVRVLVTIVFIYFVVRYFLRLLAPAILQQVVKKAGENLYQQQQQQYNTTQSEHAAQVEKKHPAGKKKVGEYIDFEEIE